MEPLKLYQWDQGQWTSKCMKLQLEGGNIQILIETIIIVSSGKFSDLAGVLIPHKESY